MQIPNFTFPEASGVDLDDMLNLFSLPLRNHSRRVAICASIMAGYAQEFLQARYINVDPAFAATVHLGATCHDLGKLMLPALIVDKADYMRHPAAGGELLELIKTDFSNEIQAQTVSDIVRYHHERPDGKGFPYGLSGRDIPPAAGICAMADWLDHRLYPMTEAKNGIVLLREVRDLTGTLFCESTAICLVRAWTQIMEQYEKWGREER